MVPSRPFHAWFGSRRLVLLSILLAGLWAAWYLQLDPRRLAPGEGGWMVMQRFFAGAFQPALTYQAPTVPQGVAPMWWKVLQAMGQTVIFAGAAVSLSVAIGLPMGFFASKAWWAPDPAGGRTRLRRVVTCAIHPLLYTGSRLIIALARSMHELLWAVLFLSAMGLTHITAAVAIAIPYSGTLAKVFSELIDEAPRDTAEALRAAGGAPMQVFAFGLVPRAMPDLIAYALYRFECGLRSSAVLGFFGIPTLGYHISVSFENLYYSEVWTYLYALVFLVVVVDWWSGAVRRRLVS